MSWLISFIIQTSAPLVMPNSTKWFLGNVCSLKMTYILTKYSVYDYRLFTLLVWIDRSSHHLVNVKIRNQLLVHLDKSSSQWENIISINIALNFNSKILLAACLYQPQKSIDSLWDQSSLQQKNTIRIVRVPTTHWHLHF